MGRSARVLKAALELDLRECVPGYEKALVKQLSSVPDGRDEVLAVFKCLGRYDVLSVRETLSLNLARTPPGVARVRSEAGLFVFGWDSNEYTSPRFKPCLGNAPAALLSLLKVSPAVTLFPRMFSSNSDEMEWVGRIAEALRMKCGRSAVYSTLGSHQLVLFQFGDDIQAMLDNVNGIRGLSLSAIGRVSDDIKMAPVIDDSVTVPLVTYDGDARLRTNELNGELKPLVFMGCPPGIEPRLRQDWTDTGAEVSEVFGKPDLLAEWPTDVGAGKFVSALVGRRQKARGQRDLAFTSSVLLRTSPSDGSELDVLWIEPGESTSDACRMIEKATKRLVDQDGAGIESDALRDNLRSLLGRLRSALKGPRFVDFVDMERFALVLARTVLELSRSQSRLGRLERLERAETLATMLAFGLKGIEDRTADGALETSAHDTPTRQSDVARILEAAAFVPEYILHCCTEKLPEPMEKLKGHWTGFVLFDRTPSPALGRKEVIILPVDWLSLPIRCWWTISHEVWHALYWRHFEVLYSAILSELLIRHGGDEEDVRTLASELFANWMDFCHCFEQDSELFQRLVWEHWLSLAVVHEEPTHYLLRSFLLHLYATDQIPILREGLDLSPATAANLIGDSWEQFKAWVSRIVPDLGDVFARIGPSGEQEVLDSALRWHPLIEFFENEFDIPELRDCIRHSDADIVSQVSELWRGEIPTDPIDNPVRILVALARESRQRHSPPSPGATAAVIHALANGRMALGNEIEGRQP